MRLETWKITGRGFHFGRHGLGQEETHPTFTSDSLFAALVLRLAALEGSAAVESMILRFNRGAPPFVLSSTFPFAGTVRFFPALAPSGISSPAQGSPAEQGGEARLKDLKKVKYVSEGLFRLLLAGATLGGIYTRAVPLQSGQVLISRQEYAQLPAELQTAGAELWKQEQRPRVTLGRAVQTSNLFFTGRVAFAEGCGLWFGVRWMQPDAADKDRLANLLHDLAEAGLGGERSVGFGACTIETSDYLELPDGSGRTWTNLSRYLPQEDELSALADRHASYRLEAVGGWLDSPARSGQRRRKVNLIGEGSVLGPLARQVPGRIVDVRPSYETNKDPLGHPVYRCGLALAVGLEEAQS